MRCHALRVGGGGKAARLVVVVVVMVKATIVCSGTRWNTFYIYLCLTVYVEYFLSSIFVAAPSTTRSNGIVIFV
jgi:hypothetical protein